MQSKRGQRISLENATIVGMFAVLNGREKAFVRFEHDTFWENRSDRCKKLFVKKFALNVEAGLPATKIDGRTQKKPKFIYDLEVKQLLNKYVQLYLTCDGKHYCSLAETAEILKTKVFPELRVLHPELDFKLLMATEYGVEWVHKFCRHWHISRCRTVDPKTLGLKMITISTNYIKPIERCFMNEMEHQLTYFGRPNEQVNLICMPVTSNLVCDHDLMYVIVFSTLSIIKPTYRGVRCPSEWRSPNDMKLAVFEYLTKNQLNRNMFSNEGRGLLLDAFKKNNNDNPSALFKSNSSNSETSKTALCRVYHCAYDHLNPPSRVIFCRKIELQTICHLLQDRISIGWYSSGSRQWYTCGGTAKHIPRIHLFSEAANRVEFYGSHNYHTEPVVIVKNSVECTTPTTTTTADRCSSPICQTMSCTDEGTLTPKCHQRRVSEVPSRPNPNRHENQTKKAVNNSKIKTAFTTTNGVKNRRPPLNLYVPRSVPFGWVKTNN